MRVTNVYAGNDCIVVEFDGSREITLSNNATNREFMREFQDSCYYQAKLHFTELVNRVSEKKPWYKDKSWNTYYVDVEVLARLYEEWNMSIAYKYDHKVTEENSTDRCNDCGRECYMECYFEDLRGAFDEEGYEHPFLMLASSEERRNLENLSKVYLELEKLKEGV